MSQARIDLLVLAAHPDDAEMCCGGTILRAVQAGQQVAVVDMTRGESGTRGTPEQRAAEAAAAAKLLGLCERVNLGLPDGSVRDDDAALAAVVGAIRRLRPALMLAPHQRELHPDHIETAKVAKRAFFHAGLQKLLPEQGEAFRPKALLHYLGMEYVEPSFCIDVSAVAERKRAAIACFGSQMPDQGADRAHYVRGLDPLERIEARDRYFGSICGCAAAEPFVSDGPVLLDLCTSILPRSPA